MAFIPAANVAHAELIYSWSGQIVENNLFFFNADVGAITGARLGVLADMLFDWWKSNLQVIQAEACRLQEIRCADLTTESGERFSMTVSPAEGVGSVATPALPNNCTLCISFRTGLAGRSFRGRNYSIGMVDAQKAGSFATTLYVGALLDAYTTLISDSDAVNWTWSVLSRVSDGIPRPAALATPVLSAIVADIAMDSQRRRLPGRGA